MTVPDYVPTQKIWPESSFRNKAKRLKNSSGHDENDNGLALDIITIKSANYWEFSDVPFFNYRYFTMLEFLSQKFFPSTGNEKV